MPKPTRVDVSPARRHIIRRPRLLKLLDETKARVILLVAPAGYGKTTLARQWVETRPHAWYRATPAAADVAALAASLSAALQDIVPGAGMSAIERLRATGAPQPDPETLAELMAATLTDWPEDSWIVVDDYHHMAGATESERFVSGLLEHSQVGLLITTRVRPKWATARHVLYGEILEVGEGALSLTHEEAADILEDRAGEWVAALMALARGWPAVIGLVSLTGEDVRTDAALRTTLYDYCAQEMFNAIPPHLRVSLCQLAVPPGLDDALLQSLFNEHARELAVAAEEAGFLASAGGGAYELHPLLRAFLEAKLRDSGLDAASEFAERVVRTLLDRGLVDEAWDVAHQWNLVTLLDEIVDIALPEFLKQGRVATLAEWADASERIGQPLRALVQAELAFRAGNYGAAARLGEFAAETLGSTSHHISQAWFRSGQAAQMMDDLESASASFLAARATAGSTEHERNALWGLFITKLDLEDEEAVAHLDELKALRGTEPLDEVRLVSGRLFHANKFGGIEEELADAQAAVDAFGDYVDPMARSGLLNALAHARLLVGQYEDALEVVHREIEEARHYGLSFVVPHARLIRAQALAGIRRFADAERETEAILRLERRSLTTYLEANATTVRARIYLGQGRGDVAAALTHDAWEGTTTRAMLGEFLATRAVALACTAKTIEAARLARDAANLTASIEVRVLTAAVAALAAMRHGGSNWEHAVANLVRTAFATGNVDGLVCAYRASPDLLQRIATAAPDADARLRLVLARARDRDLARRAGLLGAERAPALSTRELEVLNLVAQGLTNREIAERLFIAEVTVKAHLRRIFEKLGVRSRTEAALRAVAYQDAAAATRDSETSSSTSKRNSVR